jgi:hypothetical protein
MDRAKTGEHRCEEAPALDAVRGSRRFRLVLGGCLRLVDHDDAILCVGSEAERADVRPKAIRRARRKSYVRLAGRSRERDDALQRIAAQRDLLPRVTGVAARVQPAVVEAGVEGAAGDDKRVRHRVERLR